MSQEINLKGIQKIFQIKMIIEPLAITRVICEYIEQLYNIKFETLDEMGRFLEGHRLPQLTQEEIN